MKLYSNRWLITTMVIALLPVMLGACDSSSSDDDEQNQGLIWDYDTPGKGPADWASLSSEFAVCGSGSMQSPINILADPIEDAPDWQFDWRASTLKIVNDGVQVHFMYQRGSSINVDGVEHELTSIHVHAPGEHQYQGADYDGELHFVHESEAGDIAVVAVWVVAGIENKLFTPLLANIPILENEVFDDPSKFIRALDFLPEQRGFFRYDGSLSEPPCTEGVTWIVMRENIELSVAQLQSLNDILGTNNRPVQASNGRTVTQQ